MLRAWVGEGRTRLFQEAPLAALMRPEELIERARGLVDGDPVGTVFFLGTVAAQGADHLRRLLRVRTGRPGDRADPRLGLPRGTHRLVQGRDLDATVGRLASARSPCATRPTSLTKRDEQEDCSDAQTGTRVLRPGPDRVAGDRGLRRDDPREDPEPRSRHGGLHPGVGVQAGHPHHRDAGARILGRGLDHLREPVRHRERSSTSPPAPTPAARPA